MNSEQLNYFHIETKIKLESLNYNKFKNLNGKIKLESSNKIRIFKLKKIINNKFSLNFGFCAASVGTEDNGVRVEKEG